MINRKHEMKWETEVRKGKERLKLNQIVFKILKHTNRTVTDH